MFEKKSKEMKKTIYLITVVSLTDQMVKTIRIGAGENRSFSVIFDFYFKNGIMLGIDERGGIVYARITVR